MILFFTGLGGGCIRNGGTSSRFIGQKGGVGIAKAYTSLPAKNANAIETELGLQKENSGHRREGKGRLNLLKLKKYQIKNSSQKFYIPFSFS